MILSDTAIQERLESGSLVLAPLTVDQIQPASVDVRLHPNISVFAGSGIIDPEVRPEMKQLDLSKFVLEPGSFALGCTLETIGMPGDLVARVEGKSSLGRLGLVIHATAGFIDPGFCGQITLELYNMAPMPIILREGMKIAQLSFHQMERPAARPYGSDGLGSKYQHQTGPTSSAYHKN